MIAGAMLRRLGVAIRVAAQQFAHSRTGAALVHGVKTTAASFGKVLHQLWLEVTGFTFLAIAGIGAITGIREYGRYHAGLVQGPGRLVLAAAFTLSFAWFGVSSFWRIKRRQ